MVTLQYRGDLTVQVRANSIAEEVSLTFASVMKGMAVTQGKWEKLVFEDLVIPVDAASKYSAEVQDDLLPECTRTRKLLSNLIHEKHAATASHEFMEVGVSNIVSVM